VGFNGEIKWYGSIEISVNGKHRGMDGLPRRGIPGQW
jgi:hypothetical protein